MVPDARRPNSIDCTFSTSVLDDASMWVKNPVASNPGCYDFEFLAIIKKKLGKRGKNVHLPVLNICETLFSVRAPIDPDDDNTSVCMAAEVPSPATTLPAGSASTITKRYKAWSALNVSGVGARIAIGNETLARDVFRVTRKMYHFPFTSITHCSNKNKIESVCFHWTRNFLWCRLHVYEFVNIFLGL